MARSHSIQQQSEIALLNYCCHQLISLEFSSEHESRPFMSFCIGSYGCNAALVAQHNSTYECGIDITDSRKDSTLPRNQLNKISNEL
jgi:hypothetical protein